MQYHGPFRPGTGRYESTRNYEYVPADHSSTPNSCIVKQLWDCWSLSAIIIDPLACQEATQWLPGPTEPATLDWWVAMAIHNDMHTEHISPNHVFNY